MKIAWLFLGDIAYRAAAFETKIDDGDVILLGPPQTMFRPVCQWNGSEKNEVDVLGQEVLSDTDLDNALFKVYKTIKNLEEINPNCNDKYKWWWLFRPGYLITGLRENALASVALKKWFIRRRPDKVIIVREHKKLIGIDFTNPGEIGSDNILSFVAEDLCCELSIPYEIYHRSSLRQSIRAIWLDRVRPYLISYVRLWNLPFTGLSERVKKKQEYTSGGVLFFSRSPRITETFLELISTCPRELNPQLLYHQPLSGESVGTRVDIPVIRLESFSGIVDTFFNIIKSQKAYPNIGGEKNEKIDPITPGFQTEYLRHAYIQAVSLAPFWSCVEKALCHIRPCLIVASDEPGPFNQIMYKIAKLHNIPTLSMQHGEMATAEVIGMQVPRSGDLQLVRPGGTKSFLIKQGVDEKKIFIYTKQSGINNIGKCNSNQCNKVFIAGTSLGITNFMPILEKITHALVEIDSSIIVQFRPHPSESVIEYENAIKQQSLVGVNVLSAEQSLAEQLKEVKCAIVFSSSIALDIVRYGIPTIVHVFNRWPLLGYDHKAFVITHTLQEMLCQLKRYIIDREAQDMFSNYADDFCKELEQGLVSPDQDDWWLFIRRTFKI